MNLKIINPFTIKQLEEIINNGLYENIFYVDTDALAARFQGRIYNGVTIDFKITISSTKPIRYTWREATEDFKKLIMLVKNKKRMLEEAYGIPVYLEPEIIREDDLDQIIIKVYFKTNGTRIMK
jgi:hypothetical protein